MTKHIADLPQRGPRGTYRLRKKLRRALQHLADGRPLPEAAALARMTTGGLKIALRKPHVLALIEEDARALRFGLRPKAVSTFERVMCLRLRAVRRCRSADAAASIGANSLAQAASMLGRSG
jgi:hypothetical protein